MSFRIPRLDAMLPWSKRKIEGLQSGNYVCGVEFCFNHVGWTSNAGWNPYAAQAGGTTPEVPILVSCKTRLSGNTFLLLDPELTDVKRVHHFIVALFQNRAFPIMLSLVAYHSNNSGDIARRGDDGVFPTAFP